jgi:3-oxoacyl-[acyl-carrier protein] reductase
MAAGYVIAKESVLALTRVASQDWAQYSIVTNTILPVVRNEAGRLPEEFYQRMARESPIRRNGLPVDCAPVLAFLASEGAGFVNGQIIGLDGGRRLIV